MYILGVNYEYSVNKLREYNNSTSIKRSGGETKRSSATGSALLQAFKTISKTNTERTLPNKNEQKTNNAISIGTAFNHFVRRVRQNWRYTPALMHTSARQCPVRRFYSEPRVVCRRRARRSQIGSQRESYRHPWDFEQLLTAAVLRKL